MKAYFTNSMTFCIQLALFGLFSMLWLTQFTLTQIAQAQPRTVAAPVALPALSINEPRSAFAVDLNPAAIGFLPAWQLDYVHSDAAADAQMDRRGDGVALTTPLFWGAALGVSAHSVRPTRASDADRYGMASLAMAYSPNPMVSVGTALRFINSPDLRLDGITTVDAALTLRPSTWLSFTVMGRDLTSPQDGLNLGDVQRSGVIGLGLRPLGTDLITLDGAVAMRSDGDLSARGTAEVRLPFLGRALGGLEWSEFDGVTSYMATAGLAVGWGGHEVGGGVHVPKHGGDNSPGWYIAASLSGAQRPGIPAGRAVLDLTLDSSDPPQIARTLSVLDQARWCDKISAVILRPQMSGLALAHAQELREMIDALQRAGKPVACYLESASGGMLYACAKATRAYVDPAGLVRLEGLQSSVVLLGGLLERVGIRADFVRVGKYKSAPEQLTRQQLTEPAKEQKNVLFDDFYQKLITDLSADYKRHPSAIEKLIDNGPYNAQEAVSRQLVNRELDANHLADEWSTHAGTSASIDELPKARFSRHWGVAPRVGVVVVHDTIVDGKNVDVPLLGIHASGGHTIVESIDSLAEDRSIRAIVVRIDSPGGSSMASDQIWRALWRARRKKPVIASIGATAASGGYYIASAAHEIFAPPSTVTGSIGVYFGKVDVVPLARKLGIGVEYFQRGRHAGADSIWRPFTDEERALLQDKVNLAYYQFLSRVAAGRRMSVDKVHTLGQGRVWSGVRAHKAGLIDRLGGFGLALARARELAGLANDAEVVFLPKEPQGLLDLVLGAANVQNDVQSIAPEDLRRVGSMLLAISRSQGSAPQALWPYVLTE